MFGSCLAFRVKYKMYLEVQQPVERWSTAAAAAAAKSWADHPLERWSYIRPHLSVVTAANTIDTVIIYIDTDDLSVAKNHSSCAHTANTKLN